KFVIPFSQSVSECAKASQVMHVPFELLKTVSQWLEGVNVSFGQDVVDERRELPCIGSDVENRIDVQIAQPAILVLWDAFCFDPEVRESPSDKGPHRAGSLPRVMGDPTRRSCSYHSIVRFKPS